MLDRASIFSHPEVVSLLQEKFIPVAIDQANQRRQQDAEGKFYQKIANQGPRPVGDGSPTTQGLYIAAPDGTFYAYHNDRKVEHVLESLRLALKRYKPDETVPITPGQPDRRYAFQPPEGGLVVRVHSKILDGYKDPSSEREKIFQNGIGRDNFWITADEHRALTRGDVPESLVLRLARFHLVDNTRGEPPMWEPNEVRSHDVFLSGKTLRGTVHLRTDSGDREYRVELLGYVETTDGSVSRFDIVAKGLFRGEGEYTRGAPKGNFPLAIAFRLADGSDRADQIPPQGSRGWLEGYIE
ncbi:MAG: hypothetical protein MI807_22610 [Verrucomicrobiales bacterium]|nr:hypothetical protein [Verrucomicrobiales bacterium]